MRLRGDRLARLARSRAVPVGVVLQLALVLLGPAVLAAPGLPTPPPLPGPPPIPGIPNPFVPPIGTEGAPVAGCSLAPLGATEVRSLGTRPGGGQFGLDPSQPCHMFHSEPGNVLRSDSAGRAWSATTFSDHSGQSAFSHGPFVFSAVLGPGGGPAFLYDQSGNNGVVFTPDNGASWEQRINGLYTASAGPSGGITAFAVAPANANYAYLAGNAGGQTVIFYTRDAGQSWHLGGQIPAPVTSLSVDPADPSHVAAAAGGPTTNLAAAGQTSYYESFNGAAGWNAQPGPGGELAPVDIVIGGARRLYARTGRPGGNGISGIATQRFWRLNPGEAWNAIPVGNGLGVAQDTTIAYNLGNPNQMIIAAPGSDSVGAGVAFAGSLDGFNSSRYSRVAIHTPDSVTGVQVRADRGGQFFVQVHHGGVDQIFGLRVTALANLPSETGPAQGPNFVSAIKECHLHALPPQPGTGPGGVGSTPPSYVSASIAFDGVDLNYTDDQYARGTIFRMNARTCQEDTPLNVVRGDGKAPAMYALTYDSKYRFNNGDVGAILARGGTGAEHDPAVSNPDWVAIYAVDPRGGKTELAASIICGASFTDHQCDVHDPNLLTYDHYLDALWATVPAQYDVPVRGLVKLPARKGGPVVPVSTCMTTYRPPDAVPDQGMTTWEPGADGILYVALEDDRTVLRVNSATCQTIDQFTHDKYSEDPPGGRSNENDQMACDAVTFGEGAPDVPSGTGTSVLWIRDNALNLARAYPITKGFCPFPADLRLEKLPSSTRPGDTVRLCAVLSAFTAGNHAPIGGQTVHFSLGGVDLGTAVTDAAGRACITTAVPAGANSNVGVLALFTGNEAFLPARASGLVPVTPARPNPPPPPARAPVPSHVPPPQPAVVPAPPPVVQAAQAQAQSQAQAQAQAQAQGQPGIMTERQKQARVSLQRIDGARQQVDLEATRFRTAVFEQGAALGIFGLGLVLLRRRIRRSKPALARIRDRR